MLHLQRLLLFGLYFYDLILKTTFIPDMQELCKLQMEEKPDELKIFSSLYFFQGKSVQTMTTK